MKGRQHYHSGWEERSLRHVGERQELNESGNVDPISSKPTPRVVIPLKR